MEEILNIVLNFIYDYTEALIIAGIALLVLLIFIILLVFGHRAKQQVKTLRKIDEKVEDITTNEEATKTEAKQDLIVETYKDSINKFFADAVVITPKDTNEDKQNTQVDTPGEKININFSKEAQASEADNLYNVGKSGKVYSKEELTAQIKN